jgi:4-hydroxybenzoate polyprenyltransferase
MNKPSRPLAAGRLSPSQARYLLSGGIVVVLLVTRFLGGFEETTLFLILDWMYNDLDASDENTLVRNFTIATTYMLYGLGALKVACGADDSTIMPNAHVWLAVIGFIILPTMHVQDLKDINSDRVRNRKAFLMVVGRN